MPIQVLIAGRMAQLATGAAHLEALAAVGHPPLLRLAAARALLLRGQPRDRRLVERLAASGDDPLAPGLKRLLEESPSQVPR